MNPVFNYSESEDTTINSIVCNELYWEHSKLTNFSYAIDNSVIDLNSVCTVSVSENTGINVALPKMISNESLSWKKYLFIQLLLDFHRKIKISIFLKTSISKKCLIL